jgi:HK97 gp10 family phage protein
MMSVSASISTTVDTAELDKLIAQAERLDLIVATFADLIEQRAKQLVPVKTGALRDSIVTHLEGLAAEIIAGEGLDYAAAIEYGTATHPGTSYMRPALEQYTAAFIAEVAAVFN